MNPTSIKGLLQGVQVDGMGVVEGDVIAASPIKVRLLNDSTELGEDSVVVPEIFRGYSCTCDINGGEVQEAGARITMHNGLKAGDQIVMISYNHGKRYLVIGRI